MNAVIIYDDFECAAKANAMFERAAHRPDKALLWVVKSWRLALLKLPRAAEMALTDAVDAHLILIGLRNAQFFPVLLEDWLEQWAVRRHVQQASLALLNGRSDDLLPATEAPDLSHFAERHGLSFIFSTTNDQRRIELVQP